MASTPRIVFIHGIGGHPPAERYLQQWIAATKLGVDVDLPESAFSMAYWADLRGEEAEPDGEQEIVSGMSGGQRRVLALMTFTRTSIGRVSGNKSALCSKRRCAKPSRRARRSPSSRTAWGP